MIYFLQGKLTHLIKIGVTGKKHPEERQKACQLGSPDKLILIGYREDLYFEEERWLHYKLAKHHSHGEWYHPTNEVLETIHLALRDGIPDITAKKLKGAKEDAKINKRSKELTEEDVWRMPGY